MKNKWVLFILVAFVLIIPCVSALEMLQDDIVAPAQYISANYEGDIGGSLISFGAVRAINIEYLDGTSALIHADYPGTVTTYGGSDASAETSFVGTVSGVQVCDGVIGYQRSWNWLGVEQPGLQYLVFTSWDVGTLTGQKDIVITYDADIVHLHTSPSYGSWVVTPPTGYLFWVNTGTNNKMGGYYTLNKHFLFENSYSVTKGLGLGIVGSIWKQSLAGGSTYLSRAFVINATNLQIVTSEIVLSDDTFHFNVPTESIYIALSDTEGTWHNTSALFTVANASASSYSILINPSTLTLPGSVQGSLIGSGADLAKVTDIDWYWDDGTGSYDFNEGGNTSRPLSYTKVGTTWWGYERGAGELGGSYSRNKGTAFPNPVTLSNISSSGYKIVTCFIGTSDGYWYTLTSGLTVEQGGMQTLIVEATDAYSNALVSYTDMSVLDKSSNLWSNVTASGGVYNYLFPYNANLYIEGIATGYRRTTKNWTVIPGSAYILKLPMYPTGSIDATNVSLSVVVLDGATSGVMQGVNVRLSDGWVRTTTGAGVAEFTVLATTQYKITATHAGYQSATRTLTTGAGGTAQDTYLTLNRIVVTTAPTLPPGVTAVVTLDMRSWAEKDAAMMEQIRDAGPGLIGLAILATMLGLMKLMSK